MSVQWEDLEFINPYNAYIGCFTPNWLLKRKEISFGAKYTYARLIQYAGEKGIAYPRRKSLAKEISVSANQLDRYLKELSNNNLIISHPKEKSDGRNEYYFLLHPWSVDETDDVDTTHDTPIYKTATNKSYPQEKPLTNENSVKSELYTDGNNSKTKEKSSKISDLSTSLKYGEGGSPYVGRGVPHTWGGGFPIRGEPILKDQLKDKEKARNARVRDAAAFSQKLFEEKKEKTTLDDDWRLPDDWRDASLARCPAIDPTRISVISAKFRRFFVEKGIERDDWQKAWNKWFQNECETLGLEILSDGEIAKKKADLLEKAERMKIEKLEQEEAFKNRPPAWEMDEEFTSLAKQKWKEINVDYYSFREQEVFSSCRSSFQYNCLEYNKKTQKWGLANKLVRKISADYAPDDQWSLVKVSQDSLKAMKETWQTFCEYWAKVEGKPYVW